MTSDSTNDQTDSTVPDSDAQSVQTQDAATEVTATEHVADESATSESATNRPQKLLIGSQRDPANRELTPTKPKSVREAEQSVAVPSESALRGEHDGQQTMPSPTETVRSESETQPETDPSPGQPAEHDSSSGTIQADETVAVEQASGPDVETPTVQPAALENDIESELEQALESIGSIGLDQIVSGAASSGEESDLAEDSRHKATVVKVHRDDVFFALGGRHQGVVSLRQFKKPPKAGSMMDVVVRRFNAEDGLYELTIPGASVDVADWSDLTEGAVVEARITGSNTGGLECMINTLRGFIPASQIALYHVDNLAEFINQKMQCIVVEVNPRRRKLVLSHRAVLEREREEQRKNTLDQLEPGMVRDGVVRSVRDFGAFVDVGGIEGLLHISKLSWDHINHPSEVLEEGQQIRVKIEKVNQQTGKIALTLRDLLEHPWEHVDQKYAVDSVVTGTVSRIAKFGAFVKLEPGVEGMIHISELAHHHVASVANVVAEGQAVEAKVLSVDRDSQRIALSLKATQAEPPPDERPAGKREKTEPIRESAVPRRKGPLKGGTDRKSGGEQFGLNW